MPISSSVNTLLPAQPDTKDPELFAQLVRVYNAINLLANAVASLAQIYSAANGSEAAPSYTFIAEATTGAWIPGLSKYAISLGGTRAFYLDGITFNTIVGANSLHALTTGQGNTAIGNNTLANVITKDNNSALGNGAGPTGDFLRTTSLGENAHATADDEMRYGSNTVTHHRWTTGAAWFPAAVGINGKTPVVNVAAPTAAGAAYGATEQTLLNDIRTRLINFGIYT